jgi:hypothetical protein
MRSATGVIPAKAGIQYSVTPVNDRKFPAYWITRLRG